MACFLIMQSLFLDYLGGRSSASLTELMCVFGGTDNNEYFFLAFDDFPVMITLKSKSLQGVEYIPAFKALLAEKS